MGRTCLARFRKRSAERWRPNLRASSPLVYSSPSQVSPEMSARDKRNAAGAVPEAILRRGRIRNVQHCATLLRWEAASTRFAKTKTRGNLMKLIVSTLAIALALSGSAVAQTTTPGANSAPSAQNSGTGIAGQPGNKNGPAAKSRDTVGSSSGTNSTVQQQDTSNIKGLPGNKSGPAARKPEQK